MTPPIQPIDIVRALVNQVQRAQPPGKSELDVITYISRPLWTVFLVGTGMQMDKAQKQEPTEWLGVEETRRVFGSETVILEVPQLVSYSVAR